MLESQGFFFFPPLRSRWPGLLPFGHPKSSSGPPPLFFFFFFCIELRVPFASRRFFLPPIPRRDGNPFFLPLPALGGQRPLFFFLCRFSIPSSRRHLIFFLFSCAGQHVERRGAVPSPHATECPFFIPVSFLARPARPDHPCLHRHLFFRTVLRDIFPLLDEPRLLADGDRPFLSEKLSDFFLSVTGPSFLFFFNSPLSTWPADYGPCSSLPPARAGPAPTLFFFLAQGEDVSLLFSFCSRPSATRLRSTLFPYSTAEQKEALLSKPARDRNSPLSPPSPRIPFTCLPTTAPFPSCAMPRRIADALFFLCSVN